MKAGFLPSIDLVRIKNGNSSVENINTAYGNVAPGARARGFQEMLEKFTSKVCCVPHTIRARVIKGHIAP